MRLSKHLRAIQAHNPILYIMKDIPLHDDSIYAELADSFAIGTGYTPVRKFASVLDVPKTMFAPDVWKKSGPDGYILSPDIKAEIYERYELFNKEVLHSTALGYVKGLYIISSIGTYYYSNTTDIDTKVVIDFKLFRTQFPQLKDFDEEAILNFLISKARASKFMTNPMRGSERPFDWYFYPQEEFEGFIDRKAYRFDSIYSLFTQKWLKEYVHSDIDHDEVMEHALSISKSLFENLDIKLGKLRRCTILYDELIYAVKKMNVPEDQVNTQLKEVLGEIREILSVLNADKNTLAELRKKVFDEDYIADLYAKQVKSVNFSDINIVRKALEKFGYWLVLIQLSKIQKQTLNFAPAVVEEVEEVLN
jgi:hypothetical protein